MAMLKKTLLAAVTCGAIAFTGSAFAQYGAAAGAGTIGGTPAVTGSSSSAETSTHAVKHLRKAVHHVKFSGRGLADMNAREHAITENLNHQQLGGATAAIPAQQFGGRRISSIDSSERQITANLNLQQSGGSTVAMTEMAVPVRTATIGIDSQERQITAQLNRDQMNQALAFNSGEALPEG